MTKKKKKIDSKVKTAAQKKSKSSSKASRKNKKTHAALPSTGQLLRETGVFLWLHKRIFSIMMLIHFVVYYVFLRVGNELSVSDLQDLTEELLGINGVNNTLTVASDILSTKFGDYARQSSFAVMGLGFVSSLAFIWAIRQLSLGKKIRVRDPYYHGMYPLIPYGIIAFILLLQLVPFMVGGTIFSFVSVSVATSGVELVIAGIVWFFLAIVSVYWLSVSIFAMYAVTLQGVAPLEALRGVKEQVQSRRVAVARRLLIAIALVGAVSFVGLVAIISVFSNGAYLYVDFLLVFLPLVYHVFAFKLYKSLL